MATVTFELQLITGAGVETVPEQALREEHRELLAHQDVIEGAIVLEHEGQPRLAFADELPAAVQNLCFDAVAAMAEGGRDCFLYRRTSFEGNLVLIPRGASVRLIGDDTPTFTAPMRDLLPELHACGVRVLDLLDRLDGGAEYLRPFERRATAALARLSAS
jgi:hypothetical protein